MCVCVCVYVCICVCVCVNVCICVCVCMYVWACACLYINLSLDIDMTLALRCSGTVYESHRPSGPQRLVWSSPSRSHLNMAFFVTVSPLYFPPSMKTLTCLLTFASPWKHFYYVMFSLHGLPTFPREVHKVSLALDVLGHHSCLMTFKQG